MTEPSARTHPKSVYLRIKAATRELVETVGGLMFAEKSTRVRRNKLSEYGSPHLAEIFMAADVIADLEMAAGDPIVTRELARIAGHALVELPKVGEDENFVSRLAHVSQSAGQMIAKLGEALGDNGVVSASEVRELKLVALCDETIEELVMLRRAASAVVINADEKRGRR